MGTIGTVGKDVASRTTRRDDGSLSLLPISLGSSSMSEAQGQPKRLNLVEVAVVVAILSLILFLSWPILSHENVGKPLGEAIPSEPPSEANRVEHPQGFSIVFPANWEVQVGEGPQIDGTPRTIGFCSRSDAVIWLTNQGSVQPSLGPEFRPTTFQGQPAFASVERKPDTFDDEGHFRYTLYFKRDGEWFSLVYLLGRDRPSLPPMMRYYFETFRAEPGN